MAFFCHSRNYERIREIGSGGYAKVDLVRQIPNGKLVAHKIPRTSFLSPWNNSTTNDSIEHEDYIYSVINPNNDSPFIPKSYGIVRDARGRKVLELEYIQGENLSDYVSKRASEVRNNFHASVNEFLDIAQSLTMRINAIHKRGVIHTDLKINNVIRADNGSLYIYDYGLALHRIQGKTIFPKPNGGEAEYRAPEINQRIEHPEAIQIMPLGVQADYFSLGVLFDDIKDVWFDEKNFAPDFSTLAQEKNARIIEHEDRKGIIKKIQNEIIQPLMRASPSERITIDELLLRINQIREEIPEA